MIFLSVGPGPGALLAPEISRELAEAGHQIEASLEPGTKDFIGPSAFAEVASLVDSPTETPQALIFAPATSGTLARLAHGLDPIAGRTPTVVAPELDGATASHPAVRRNIELLRRDNRIILERELGRMVSAGEIVTRVLGRMGGVLGGLRVLVTAGGTREPIDSVRFVGNRSSGKMGRAIAREARRLGAEVSIVAANVDEIEPGGGWIAVETFAEMREEVLRRAGEFDALIMAAAVSDFTPASRQSNKIRRKDRLTIELVETADILKEVRDRNPDLFVVGFSATHGDPASEAREKLRLKGANLVVGNDISRPDIGFGTEENEVYIAGWGGERFVRRASKREVARTILDVMQKEMGKERWS